MAPSSLAIRLLLLKTTKSYCLVPFVTLHNLARLRVQIPSKDPNYLLYSLGNIALINPGEGGEFLVRRMDLLVKTLTLFQSIVQNSDKYSAKNPITFVDHNYLKLVKLN